ncbi:MAG: hypothetical protein QM737_12480 [Ferruginibacter sp.]
MNNKGSIMKYCFLIALVFIALVMGVCTGYGQAPGCGIKKIKKYQYYNIATHKVSGEYERIFLNDSVFYEIAFYRDSNSRQPVIKDTFKIVNGNWYYKLQGNFKLFFNVDSFIAKVPIIQKAYEFNGKFYGYGACTSYTPVEKIDSAKKIFYKFYVSDGDCNGGVPKGRIYNPTYYYFEPDIGFTIIKDRFDEYKMEILE